ncbi:MAG: GNAT family N-acetyltransferase, partial [Planctomycetes bacterium]|nr:GNAT family N-acetyltransferase [Planctomycetota bacterium]
MPEAVGAAAERPPVRWRVREATAADRDGILACRAVTFAGEEPEKGEPDYWRWEFVDNHAGPARLFVAEDDTRQGAQRIVGHYAVIPQRFVLDGATLRGSIVVDVMTHPDYRFQGMFTKIGRFALDACTADPGFEFTTGYPIRKEVIPGHLKVGWRIRFRIGTYVMPLRTGKVLAAGVPALAKVPGLATVVGSVPGWVLRGWSRAALRQRGGLRVERSERVDTNRL